MKIKQWIPNHADIPNPMTYTWIFIMAEICMKPSQYLRPLRYLREIIVHSLVNITLGKLWGSIGLDG